MDAKERNDGIQTAWKQDVKQWEVERDSAKFDCQKPRWMKPKKPLGEKIPPKPKVFDFVDGSEEEGNMDNMDEDENEDGEISDGNDSD